MKIVEKEIDWTKFFLSIIGSDDELIRAYWFRPAKILDTYYTSENVKKSIVYKKYRHHLENYKSGNLTSVPQTVKDDVDSECKKVLEWIKAQKDKFANIEYAYDQYYNHRDIWNTLVRNAMKYDVSFDKSAKEYESLYYKVLES